MYPKFVGKKFTCKICGKPGRNIAIGKKPYERSYGNVHGKCFIKVINNE
jgi:hypothetical protein